MWIACTIAVAQPVVLVDAHLPGGQPVEIAMEKGRIVSDRTPGEIQRSLNGATVVPGLVDSHVHLQYWPVAEQLLDAGVVAAVDLAAPLTSLSADHALELVQSGPMITAGGGYPTTSWGRNGYGLEVRSSEEAEGVVDRLHDAGARVIKVPLDHGPTLDASTLSAVVTRAHEHGMITVAHAMDDGAASRAADAGIDVLAHTPTRPLSDATVAAWAQPHRAVISSLTAFGAGPGALGNLRRLHQAGARILYGTDLGNRRVAGVDAEELRLLAQAGLTPAEILAACTTLPAQVWSLEGIGTLTPGAPAHLLVLDGDPLDDPTLLARPQAVYVRGARRAGAPRSP